MSPTVQRIVLRLLAGAIVVSLAVALADLTWHIAGDASAGNAAPVVTASADTAASQTDLTPILALAPFGAAAPPPEAAPKETALGLRLVGVVLAEPAAQSTAIIAGADGVGRVYAIGERLPGAAVLETVLADRVTLRVAGRLETLSFPQAPAPSSGVAAIRASIPVSAGGGAPPSPPRAPAAAKDPDAIADDFRQRIASNPQTVLTDVGLAATKDGYRLEDSMMPELRRAGLKPGDLVVRVNGNKVGNVESDRSLFDEVVASGRARVEVMREGSLIVMSFPLR